MTELAPLLQPGALKAEGAWGTTRKARIVWPALLVLLTGLPLLWLTGSAALAVGAGDNGFAAAMLPVALRETVVLMLSVGGIAAAAGLVAAWLVTHFSFPGRRLFEWALILPLAVPTYLAAYTWVEFLDFTGPVQGAVRALLGAETLRDYWFPPIRSNTGAALVLGLTLYPYIYVSCRAFFLMQSGAVESAARTLGAGPWRSFLTVVLPLSRPALVVGVTMAMLEVLNDLGAVQYFGVNSLTATLYATWISRSNFGGAAQLAVAIVLMVGLLIGAEHAARRDRLYLGHRDSRTPPTRRRLRGGPAAAACLVCAGILALGFGIPALELVALSVAAFDGTGLAATGQALVSTLLLAVGGAALTVGIGLLAARRLCALDSPPGRTAVRLALLGYAIPGTVLALGLLQPMGLGDRWLNAASRSVLGWGPGLVLSGSVAALLYAYTIRFLAVSGGTLEAAIRRRGRSLLDAGHVLGAGRWTVLLRLDLPTLTPALLAAATLVFVEIIKELPATLLLRPLGLETLSTLVYARANAALFAEAALPALAIVLAGLVPVIVATRLSAPGR